MEKQIVWLSVDLLYPHPDNPRRDVGDVSELAESIKAKGVLQNLTVVPYKSKLHPDKVFSGYTVIIGHRRLAAAKKAGIDKLPCVIADMTEHEQVETMLLENMQRSDLTAFEEAKGIQMMFDFGETVETISEKTGFSKSTIRRRAKMLLLGDKALEKIAKKKQVTFEEIEKLSDIKDFDEREKCINALGTKNFKNEYEKALKHQTTKENIERCLSLFAERGITEISEEDSDKPKYKYVTSVNTNSESSIKEIEELEIDTEYFYSLRHYSNEWFYIYRKRTAADERKERDERTEQKRREAERQAIYSKLNEAYARYKGFWEDFIVEMNESDALSHLDVALCQLEKLYNGNFSSFELKYKSKATANKLLEFILNRSLSVCDKPWDYYGKYDKNVKLERVHSFIRSLGYVPSDEEEAFMNGTSDLFVKGNK